MFNLANTDWNVCLWGGGSSRQFRNLTQLQNYFKVYNILPPTTAILGYVLGNWQFFHDAQKRKRDPAGEVNIEMMNHSLPCTEEILALPRFVTNENSQSVITFCC